MNRWIKKFFIDNWERKGISLLFALMIWLLVNRSLTVTKTFDNLPVRILNIPSGYTVEGLGTNQILNERISLTVSGNRSKLESLSSTDLEVLLDATDKKGSIETMLKKKHLVSLDPDTSLDKAIKSVETKILSWELKKVVTLSIPIRINWPHGSPPKGYEVVGVSPSFLRTSIAGTEEALKKLQSTGIDLSFDLALLRDEDLLSLDTTHGDIITFPVPIEWKKVLVPFLSETPFPIDDPRGALLHIDFCKKPTNE